MGMITDTAIVDLVRELVAAGQPWCENSIDGPAIAPEETRIATLIAPKLSELGFEVELAGRHPTRQNVVATRRFGPGPTLMLNDHLDTYPSGPPSRWTTTSDPYDIVERDGRLFGRGTSDTRGNLAALLLAVEHVMQDPPDRGTLIVALTVDEERNGVEGSVYLLNELRLAPDASITVEPTAWAEKNASGIGIAVQHTGHALIDVTITGTASHLWRPDTGVNCAHALISFIRALNIAAPRGWPISVIALNAGESGMGQFTPHRATARLAIVGIGPDVARAEVIRELEKRAAKELGRGLHTEIALVPGPTFIPGTERLGPAEPIVQALTTAYHEQVGVPPRLYTKPAFCDTSRFRHAGIPAVTFGPGDDGWAVYDESISIEQITLAIRVLHHAIRGYLETPQADLTQRPR